MAEGFLKGLWGKPAVSGTGLMGIWGTVKSKAGGLVGFIMSPFKVITYIIIIAIGLLLYKRMKK